MAGQNTIQATQTGEADVFRPKRFNDAPLPLSDNEARERRLYKVTPELEHLADVEWNALDQWVAFKIAPHFVDQIYKGESLEIDPEVVQSDYLIPEYRTAQGQYFSESAHIVGTHIPGIRRRIKQYSTEAGDLETSAGYNQYRIDQGDRSPKLETDRDAWLRQAKSKRTLVKDLTADIPKAEMNARVKDAMYYKINGFVERAERGECADEIDTIIFASKKRAFEQVINTLKSDRAILDEENEDEEVVIRGYNRKIELLQGELTALEAAHEAQAHEGQSQAAAGEVIQESAEAKAHPNLLQEFRCRLLGSFSSRAAALYGAFNR